MRIPCCFDFDSILVIDRLLLLGILLRKDLVGDLLCRNRFIGSRSLIFKRCDLLLLEALYFLPEGVIDLIGSSILGPDRRVVYSFEVLRILLGEVSEELLQESDCRRVLTLAVLLDCFKERVLLSSNEVENLGFKSALQETRRNVWTLFDFLPHVIRRVLYMNDLIY